MKTTEFMDKQVMELSESQFEDHSFRFLEADTDDDEEEEAVDQFRLHRNRHYGAPLTSSSSLDQIGSTKTTNKSNNTSMVAEVDRIMKELSNKLLLAIEDLSGRLSQLESKMHYLENSMNDLKVSIEYDHGKTDGKLRQLENILREVQNGVQLLKDTQQIAEIQSQQAKVQAPSIPQTEGQNIKVPEPPSLQTTPIAPKQSQPTPLSTDTPLLHDMLSNVSYQNQFPVAAPPTPSQGSPDWLSYNPRYPPSYNPPLSQTLGAYHQQIKPPVPPPTLPHPNYQTAPELPQPLHSTHPSLLHYCMPDTGNVQTHFPPKNHPDERTYTPHSYNPTITESPFKYPGGQFAQHPYSDFTNQVKPTHHPSGSQYSEFSDRANKPYGFGNYNDTSPFSTMKTSEFSSAWALDRENENTQLPKAKILLPHALPTASFVASTEPSTGGTGNTAPDDEDVVEKVTSMGFRRDLVKATVKKLADNGQSVDLNEVLDKLMNN
nr:vegetative cell wall protein gp1 isoform X2 [Ipomoea batatas]